MEVAASLLELGVAASAHLLPKGGADNEFQTQPGALTATDISVQGGVDNGAQTPHSLPGLSDAIDKQGVNNQGAHLESLEAACSEAVTSPGDEDTDSRRSSNCRNIKILCITQCKHS